FEREEGEIVDAPVRLQIVDEAAEPGNFPVRVGPDLDIAEGSFEWGASQLGLGNKLVDGGRELYIQRAVVFRKHVLPVSLFSHLYPRNRILAFVEIGDLVGRIFRRGIEHSDRD